MNNDILDTTLDLVAIQICILGLLFSIYGYKKTFRKVKEREAFGISFLVIGLVLLTAFAYYSHDMLPS